MKSNPENKQQAANHNHTRRTNTQRISHVLATLIIDGRHRSIPTPTTPRERIHVLQDNSQYIPGGR